MNKIVPLLFSLRFYQIFFFIFFNIFIILYLFLYLFLTHHLIAKKVYATLLCACTKHSERTPAHTLGLEVRHAHEKVFG